MKTLLSFVAGAVCGGVIIFLVMSRHTIVDQPRRASSNTVVAKAAPSASSAPSPGAPSAPSKASPSPANTVAKGDAPSGPLPQRVPGGSLTIPVADFDASQLTDTFTQSRAAGRPHEAIDIMAPRGTPVIAVADGKVVKLFNSKPGGLTVYQFDVEGKLAYYYAHLDRYAPGLAEGQRLKRGELIGFVGSSGNADAAHPHLHFAIFELGPEKRWWEGRAINPYPLLTGREGAAH